jgi:hypothetical protein
LFVVTAIVMPRKQIAPTTTASEVVERPRGHADRDQRQEDREGADLHGCQKIARAAAIEMTARKPATTSADPASVVRAHRPSVRMRDPR